MVSRCVVKHGRCRGHGSEADLVRGGGLVAMGVRLAYRCTSTLEIADGSSLALDLDPLLWTGRQADFDRLPRSFPAIHFGGTGLEVVRAVSGIGRQQGQRARRPGQELEVEPDRQDEQRGHAEQGLGGRRHHARGGRLCAVVEVAGQEGWSLGPGRRGRRGLGRLHVGLWELCPGWVVTRSDSDVELAIRAGEKDVPGQRGAGSGKGQETKGGQGEKVGERDYGTMHGRSE